MEKNEANRVIAEPKRDVLARELTTLINRLSLENALNYNDFIIAEMMVGFLENCIRAHQWREKLRTKE